MKKPPDAGASRPAAPAAGGVDRLIADLHSTDPIHRDAAVARLRVAAGRALPRLSVVIQSDPDPGARAAALSALDGSDNPRAMDLALAVLDHPSSEVVVAALGVLSGWVTREAGTRVLDALTTLALARTRDARIRLAALDALADLPRHLVQPIVDSAAAAAPAADADDPSKVREWLAAEGAGAPLSTLHDLISRIRQRERGEPSARRRLEWLGARGATHVVLAERGSRVALYDLREAFDAADRGTRPLPLDFLVAVTAIGDASCLEPMARAWAAARTDAWWRERLAEAAADIMRRTRLTGRSAIVKRIRAKWVGFI